MPYYQHERLLRAVPQVEPITYEGSGHIFLFDEGGKTARLLKNAPAEFDRDRIADRQEKIAACRVEIR